MQELRKPLDGMPNMHRKVYIVGSCFRGDAIRMFSSAGCTGAANIPEADFVAFLGGADINPALYGEKLHRRTSFSEAADNRDIEAFEEAAALEKPMFGICRGFQFLGAMNGNKLYQHVDNHGGRPHMIEDTVTGEKLLATSIHHQMVIENDTTFALAYAPGHSGTYMTYGSELSSNKVNDLEAAVFPNINAMGVQGHPELDSIPAYSEWAMNKLDEFLNEQVFVMGDNAKSIKDVDFIKKGLNE